MLQGGDGDVDDGYSEGVRHAETPELAREALADCAILIFKGQVEVAFRSAQSLSEFCCSRWHPVKCCISPYIDALYFGAARQNPYLPSDVRMLS